MSSYNPISNAKGTIAVTTIVTIYTVPSGKYSKITNVKFTPPIGDTTPYTISFFVGYNNGTSSSLVYSKILNGGDSVNDDSEYKLAAGMNLMAQANVPNLIEYTIMGEEYTP